MPVATTTRVPFAYVAFNNQRAFQGPATLKYKVLLLGERLSTGTKAANSITKVTSADQVKTYAGAGSILHRMAQAWFKNNTTVEVYMQPITESTGNKATISIVFTGTATAAGAVYLTIDDELIQSAVAIGDTASDVSSAVATAINAKTYLPFTADGTTTPGTLVVTCNNKGTVGNDFDARINYNYGEALPAGITAVVAGSGHQGTFSSGTLTPDVTDAIAAWSDTWFNMIVGSVTDDTNLDLIEAELESRFGADRMIAGRYFCAKRDTLSNSSTYGNARNSKHTVAIANGGVLGDGGPTSSIWVAAGAAGRAAESLEKDPARPVQFVEIIGAHAPTEEEKFSATERNTLLWDGMSTLRYTSDGKVQIERLITTYQTNSVGSDDISYLNLETMATLDYIRYDWKQYMENKYARAKLADDGNAIAPSSTPVMTPSLGAAEAVARARVWERLGLVENVDQFKADLVCQRNEADPDRLDLTLGPDLVNQLRILDTDIQFLLQAPAAASA